ncbi:MAG TPA: right-handed parallel beta-helix repeat-containing protein [Pseudonocardiaceae bacterium]|nr:right-handed parallel beta-helix repeat-containing protein [Pseudonocardiaceae bacterium]
MTHLVVRLFVVIVIGLVLLAAGCTSGPPEGERPPRQVRPLPADCTTKIVDPGVAMATLAQVLPGEKVCLSGDALVGAELTVRTSGTPRQPITVVADGAPVRSVNVEADHVIVDGFSILDGEGLTMKGRGLVARNNMVYNAVADGIVCTGCADSTIESNTVRRADGTGIYFAGERITVQNNTVSESVRKTQGDADGIRFFGSGHRMRENTIKDIKDSGYEGDPRGGPHTDCFQTYNTPNNPPTADVVIADNTCTNVDVQCLIATADRDVHQSVPAGRPSITFERNRCEVNGAQAVLLENFPDVVLRDNTFSGPGYRAVLITRDSTGCVVTDNTVTGELRPYEVDESSRPGFQESGNGMR